MNTSDTQKQFYGQTQVVTSSVEPESRAAKARAILAGLPMGLLLDVGCADGSLVAPLKQHHQLHGVDISHEGVRLARERGVAALQADFVDTGLPYLPSTFDIVFCGGMKVWHRELAKFLIGSTLFLIAFYAAAYFIMYAIMWLGMNVLTDK